MRRTATPTPTYPEGARVLCRVDMNPRPGTVQLAERGRYRVLRDGDLYPVWCTGCQLEALGEGYDGPQTTTFA